MNCGQCEERMADFLLDELPSTEAVLVQEHINICDKCRQRYRELKDTGKALETVRIMAPVTASPRFAENVNRAASEESRQIIAALTPERRLDWEVREAVREQRRERRYRSTGVEQKTAAKTFRSRFWVLIMIAGATAAAALFFAFRRSTPPPHGFRRAVWRLRERVGMVRQAVAGSRRRWVPAVAEKDVFTGDELSVDAQSCVRLEALRDGKTVRMFLGPNARAAFENGPSGRVRLLRGECGLEIASSTAGKKDEALGVSVLTETAFIRPDGGCRDGLHVWIHTDTDAEGVFTSIRVLIGAVLVSEDSRTERSVRVKGGEVLTVRRTAELTGKAASLLPPVWRASLCSREELAGILGAAPRILTRRFKGVEVLLECGGFGAGRALGGWRDAENSTGWKRAKAGTFIGVPRRKIFLAAPLAPPLSMELVAGMPLDTGNVLALGMLDEGAQRGLSVDVGSEAVLELREPNKVTERETVARKGGAGKAERLRLAVECCPETTTTASPAYFSAFLETGAGKSAALRVPAAHFTAGSVWVQPLQEGVDFELLRVRGYIPAPWLRLRMKQKEKE